MAKVTWKLAEEGSPALANDWSINSVRTSDWLKRYCKANHCRQRLMDHFPNMTEEQLDFMEQIT